jgi:predicted transcriptional regulator
MNIAGNMVHDEFDEAEAVQNDLTALTASIVVSYVARNSVQAGSVPDLIGTVHTALTDVSRPTVPEVETKQAPAVPIKKSVQNEQLTCLECGKSQISLKRHLRVAHNLNPPEYRMKWDLRPDYPMVAPGYSARRSALAIKLGLGRKPKAEAVSESVSAEGATSSPAKAKRTRTASRRKTSEA